MIIGNSLLTGLFILLSVVVECRRRSEERTSLAELPLDRLLNVKHALATKDLEEAFAKNRFKGDPSTASRLKKTPLRRGYWEEEHGWKGKGKGDVQTIFQTTITILSFLAFGGYLLCLILQAIRNRRATTTPTTTVAPAATITLGRKKRSTHNDEQIQTMFNTLRQLAEGYAKYEQLHRKP